MNGLASRFFSFSRSKTFSSGRQIRTAVLWRLITAGIVLALLAGASVYFVEMHQVDITVREMAIRQAKDTVENSLDLIKNPTEINMFAMNERLHRELEPGHFVLIEIYSNDKLEIAQAELPGMDVVDQQVAQHKTLHLEQGVINYRNFSFEDHHYVQIFTPLDTADGEQVGYFEGLYKVPKAQWDEIIRRVNSAALSVIITILVAMGILYPIILRLIRGLVSFSSRLAEANIGMLVSMGAAIAKRDSDTDAHNYRVTILAVMLAKKINLPAEEMRTLIVGSFLHDVGKIAIPDGVLLKPGKLEGEEWVIMQSHVLHGMDVIEPNEWLAQAGPVVHGHHERYDGSGYPQGLAGTEIPLVARIFALADVFDALASKRPYKEPFPLEKCLEIIEQGRGNHFDPELIDPFVEVINEFDDVDLINDSMKLRERLVGYVNTYFQVGFSE